MVGEIVKLFVELLEELFSAGEDEEKRESALMAAEEKIAKIRAEQKFG